MKLILIPLFIIILLAVSVQLINFSPIQTTFDGTASSGTDSNEQINTLGVSSTAFTVTVMGGFIALFTAIAVVGVLSGLNISVLGSTVQISERSQKILFNSMLFGGIWGIFSVLATVGISGLGLFSIPVWGALFYLILTLIYVLGIVQQINTPTK